MSASGKVLTKMVAISILMLLGYKLYKNFDHNIKRILITGSNRGIGFAIAKYILQNTTNYHIILSGRNPDKIENAKQTLISLSASYTNRITTLIMDVSDEENIKNASIELQKQFHNDLNLYCIVNNAGIFPELEAEEKNMEIGVKTMNTNFWGTVHVTKYFGPLLCGNNLKEGRIVNISSNGSAWIVSKMSEEKRDQMLNPEITMDELQGSINEFLVCYDTKDTKSGFPYLFSHAFSKAAVNTFTCLIAPKLEFIQNMNENKKITINCCTPGMVDTEMMDKVMRIKKTVESGIIVPIYLILGGMNEENGKFWGGNKCEEFCLDECISVKLKEEMNKKEQIMFVCNDSLGIHRYYIAKKQDKWSKVMMDIAKKWKETAIIAKLRYKSKWVDTNSSIEDLMTRSGFKQSSYIKAVGNLNLELLY